MPVRSVELEEWARRVEFSEVDIEGLQNALAAEWAIAVVDWVAHQNFSSGLTET